MKMKTLFLALLISTAATAQDSSAIYMPIILKQKYTAALVPQYLTVQDVRLVDSLKKAIGSGNSADSQATVYFKTGTFYKMLENFLQQPVGGFYAFANDFFTSTLASNGYSGIMEQLTYWANTGTANKAAATWLRAKVLALLAAHQAVLTQQLLNGAARAKTVITYN